MHWFDVSGTIDPRSTELAQQATEIIAIKKNIASTKSAEDTTSTNALADMNDTARILETKIALRKKIICSIKELKIISESDARTIHTIAFSGASDTLTIKMIYALQRNILDQEQFLKTVEHCEKNETINNEAEFLGTFGTNETKPSLFAWKNDEEWAALQEAVAKDKDVILQAAKLADIEPRLLVGNLIGEQTRLFHSQRQLFKQYFEPLKILGNSTIISLGIMGIKPPTAQAVEQNLKNSSSPFYLGKKYEHLLNYPSGVNEETERFNRLTDAKNSYFCYLYGALYIKQLLTQWEKASYDIQHRPEIAGTLYNVGFAQSKPKTNPQVGGSSISAGGREYSFGMLVYEFYYSGALLDVFPFQT